MADLYESTVCCTGVFEGGGVEMRKSERERRAQRKRRKGRRKYTIVSLSSSLVRRSGGKKQLKPPPFHWPLLDCGWRGLITRTRLRLLYTPRKKSAHILCAMFLCPVKYNLSCSLILLLGTEFTIIPTDSLALRNPTSLS